MRICHASRVVVISSGLLAIVLSGCGRSPSAPATLRVISLQPSVGLVTGGTPVSVYGVGFEPGATVTVDNIPLVTKFVSSIGLTTVLPAHAAGAVDVVVTNPGGSSYRLPNGYTYEQMAVKSVLPALGTTSGGTAVLMEGKWFQPGVVVTLGGALVPASLVGGGSRYLFVVTEPHAAGAVDIVVTNPDGQVDRVPGGYTFAPPDSFDLNGTWDAYTPASPEIVVFTFTIQNNALVSVKCGQSPPFALAPAPPVSRGEFTYSTSGGTAMFGRVLTTGVTEGTINLAPCPVTTWDAYKR